MPKHYVTWRTEVQAETHTEAAQKAAAEMKEELREVITLSVTPAGQQLSKYIDVKGATNDADKS